MAVFRGTTPTITLRVKGTAFENSTLYVTLEQGAFELTKTGNDVLVTPTEDGSTVGIYLSQEETLQFVKGTAKIQIRWINSIGKARATKIKNIEIDPILLEGVIEYVGS